MAPITRVIGRTWQEWISPCGFSSSPSTCLWSILIPWKSHWLELCWVINPKYFKYHDLGPKHAGWQITTQYGPGAVTTKLSDWQQWWWYDGGIDVETNYLWIWWMILEAPGSWQQECQKSKNLKLIAQLGRILLTVLDGRGFQPCGKKLHLPCLVLGSGWVVCRWWGSHWRVVCRWPQNIPVICFQSHNSSIHTLAIIPSLFPPSFPSCPFKIIPSVMILQYAPLSLPLYPFSISTPFSFPSFRARGWDAFTNVRWYCESASTHSNDRISDHAENKKKSWKWWWWRGRMGWSNSMRGLLTMDSFKCSHAATFLTLHLIEGWFWSSSPS